MNSNIPPNEINFHLILGPIDHTLSMPPTISIKDGKLTISGSRFVLGGGPAGGLHAFSMIITEGLTAGNYDLNAEQKDIVMTYVAPRSNITDTFTNESGLLTLNQKATIENIDAIFNCKAVNVNADIKDRAKLNQGIILFNQSAKITATGELKGTIEPGNYRFTPTIFSMNFVEAPDHPGFLTLDAAVGNQRLFVHIPKAKLGDGTTQTLPINKDESGKSALSTLLYGDVYHAESGEITFNYNERTQTLTGDLSFQATGTNPIPTKITFSSKGFKVTGLDV